MPVYKMDCKTCKRQTPHHSPGTFLNDKGEKRRNMICDFCGTTSNHPVNEEEGRNERKPDEEIT